jgi:hypothetical protein
MAACYPKLWRYPSHARSTKLAERSWVHSFIAWPLYIGLGCWSYTNFDQWTHRTNTSATIERTTTRRHELENQYGLSTLKQRYEDAKSEGLKLKADRETVCKQNDGSRCQRYDKVTIPSAIRSRETAWNQYMSAMSEIDRQSKEDTSTKDKAVFERLNALLPLLGGILLKLVARK